MGARKQTMTQPTPGQCPLCSGQTEVREVACLHCGVQVRGQFSVNHFDRLAPEQAQFLEAFLRCRGVIRDVEAMLGISYPTVRARLDTLLAALNFDSPSAAASASRPEDAGERRKAILAAISAGTLDADSGLAALRELQ